MKKIISGILFVMFFIGITSCQKQKEEGLYITALEDIKNGNTKSAIENLEKLVEENPYSEFAPDAYFTLASLYQSLDADSIHKAANYQIALNYYQQMIDKFPNHSKTPESIFMAGFICAEYLKDYNQARYFYKKFLKAYPNHELSVSIRAELENLGKTPEEILREKGVEIQTKGGSR